MPSSWRVRCSSVSPAISLGRNAAAKPTSSSARSRSPGKVSGIACMAARSGSSTSAVFLRNGRRWARRDAGKGAPTPRRGGRRRVAGEQMQVADRRVAQAQCVDRELVARLGGEKRGDGLGRGRQRGLAVRRAPLGEARDGGAVGAARVFRPRGAPVLRGGVRGVGKARGRRRQFDDRLEVEPVRGRPPGAAPAGSGAENFSEPCAGGSGKIAPAMRRIIGRHAPRMRRVTSAWENAKRRSRGPATCSSLHAASRADR